MLVEALSSPLEYIDSFSETVQNEVIQNLIQRTVYLRLPVEGEVERSVWRGSYSDRSTEIQLDLINAHVDSA